MDLLEKISRKLTDKDYKALFEKGVFVFDTNVLLDLYRLPNEAKEDLFLILESKELKDRVWLPFQAQLEYVYNKNGVIREQNTKFDEVSSKVNSYQKKIAELYGEIQKDVAKLNLKKRHSSIKIEDYINENLFQSPVDTLKGFTEKLDELNKKQPDVKDDDEIGDRIKKIFKSKIGESFKKEELEDFYKEGAKRYKNKVPPGYKDDTPDKEGSHFYEDKEYIRKYGDLLLWKEVIKKAETDKVEYLVLVSSDMKEDWQYKHTPVRLELLNEIYNSAKKLIVFHMYDTSNFMKYAKEYLKLDVEDSSIQEAKDIQKEKSEKSIDVITRIKSAAEGIAEVTFSDLKSYSPTISVLKSDLLFDFLIELFIHAPIRYDTDKLFRITLFEGSKNKNYINLHIEVTSNDVNKLSMFFDLASKEYPKKHAKLGVFTFRKNWKDDDKFSLTIELIITP